MPNESFEALAASMVGLPLSHVWRGYGSAIFIEIGDLTQRVIRDGSPGQPEGELSLGVEWSWRIEDKRSIICGSWSEEELWESSLDLLRNDKIIGLELFGALPEILIHTEQGNRFASFSTTEGQPQWYLVDRRSEPVRWFTVRDGQLHIGDGTELVV